MVMSGSLICRVGLKTFSRGPLVIQCYELLVLGFLVWK